MDNNNDMKKMTVVDLKALAYDLLAMIENCQNNLKVINGELIERSKPSEELKDKETISNTTKA